MLFEPWRFVISRLALILACGIIVKAVHVVLKRIYERRASGGDKSGTDAAAG